MTACYACRKASVTRTHLSTEAHRRATRPAEGAIPRGRLGWMIALRTSEDDRYDAMAESWPSYPAVGQAPLIGDPE